MKKTMVFLVVFFLFIMPAWAESENIRMGGSLSSSVGFTGDNVSVSIGFLPWFRIPVGEEHDLDIVAGIWGRSDSITASPEVTLSMFRNVFLVGSYANLGFDFSGNEPNFFARQAFFGELGYEWKHFSFKVGGEHELDYLAPSERLNVLTGSTLFHIRDGEHTRPYPWTITIGPDVVWFYSFNEDDHYYRDIVILNTRFEIRSMSQGDNDEFPRNWSPRQTITFVNRFDRQEWLENSYDWVWNPSVRLEFSVNPLENLRLGASTTIPVTWKGQESYSFQQFSASINARVQLY